MRHPLPRDVRALIPALLMGLIGACATSPPLTLRAYPQVAVSGTEVRFVAKYTGVLQPAQIEWTLCRIAERHEADMAESRPLVWENYDVCSYETWPQVRLRDAAGKIIATGQTDHPIQIGPVEGMK